MQNQFSERMKQPVSELKDAYAQEQQSTKELAQAAVETSKQAVGFADDWVRYNSWKLIGITLGVGLVLGLLLGRRSDDPQPERLPR